jgi:hypothetical protein
MKYTTTFRTFAFSPETVELLPHLNEQFGEEAFDGLLAVQTIACGWDDSEHTRLRALRFPETASLTDLKDGRKAYTALWSLRLLKAFDEGFLPDVQELTAEELSDLIETSEEMPIAQILTEEESVEESDEQNPFEQLV